MQMGIIRSQAWFPNIIPPLGEVAGQQRVWSRRQVRRRKGRREREESFLRGISLVRLAWVAGRAFGER